jgi:hypothetical protein
MLYFMKLVTCLLIQNDFQHTSDIKHNRSEMVAVLEPYEALPYYIHTYFGYLVELHKHDNTGGVAVEKPTENVDCFYCSFGSRRQPCYSPTGT